MKTIYYTVILFFGFSISSAWAGSPVVPEIDASNAMLGLGLTAGIIALIRERGRKK